MREELQKATTAQEKTTKAEALAETIVRLALEGDRAMIPLVWRYVDGEPKDARSATLREIAEHIAEKTGQDAQALLAAFERDMGAA